jgi:homoserine dehydrogenase
MSEDKVGQGVSGAPYPVGRPDGAPCRIGIAGLGTVGAGLIELLRVKPDFAPCGRRAEVAGVSARSRSRPRSSDVSAYPWFDDPVALAVHPDVDVFVELIGGADGSAKAAVEAALNAGKPVVTANKALIAEHGLELARLAEAKGAPLVFEAAVMGGVPAVKLVRESLVGDDIASISGILNGTCNYILSEMEATGRSFADVPIPSWTSAGSMPRIRSSFWRPWPSAAPPTSPPPRSRGSRRSSCWTSPSPTSSATASS